MFIYITWTYMIISNFQVVTRCIVFLYNRACLAPDERVIVEKELRLTLGATLIRRTSNAERIEDDIANRVHA